MKKPSQVTAEHQSHIKDEDARAGLTIALGRSRIEMVGSLAARHLLELLALVAAGFALGIVTTARSGVGAILVENWKLIFVSLSTLCLGFGFAAFLYGRFRQAQASAIKEQYDALRVRADDLVKQFDAFERDKIARPS